MREMDGWVDTVHLDIKKACDRVPHKRLLWKLEHVGGLRGSVLKWSLAQFKRHAWNLNSRTVKR